MIDVAVEPFSSFLRWDPVYLNVSYNDRESVKRLGANWDPIKSKWFVHRTVYEEGIFSKWVCQQYFLCG